MMNYLLLIDTSTDRGVVAVCNEKGIVAHKECGEARNHAATINLKINETLEEAKIGLPDLAGINVCGGPGSYTGLRIGMATAKGLCYALDKPLFMTSRLTILAYQAWRSGQYNNCSFTALLKAREKEYFTARYNADFSCAVAPQHILESELQSVPGEGATVVTTDVLHLAETLPMAADIHLITTTDIDTAAWSALAFEHFEKGENVDLALSEPFYLKQVYTHK